MVKKRHRGVPVVPFRDPGGSDLGLEVVGLSELIAREVEHDLTQPQRPSFHHLLLVTRGPGRHTVDFTTHRLRVGDVLHVAPGQVQQFSLDASLDAQMIVFEPDFIERAPIRWGAARRFSAARQETVRQLFEITARERAGFDGSPGARAALRAVVQALVRCVDTASEQAGPPTPLGRFEAALETSFHRAHEVAAYAAILDCSPRTLTRLCERGLGAPAKKVIDARVLLEARRLLAHGRDSAAQIGAQLGFAEATQFGKFFRRASGETPAHFRARYQTGR